MKHHQIEIIGKVHSPYQQKFAVPRQPGLVRAATTTIELTGPYSQPDCCRGLLDFSHIWVIFVFHQTVASGWKPLVRPPRLGGNQRKGVFATRATYRPNGLGMSVVKLLSIDYHSGSTWITVEGADWVDETPVVDIKPYLPYADSVIDAQGGFADNRPTTELVTHFSEQAIQDLALLADDYPNLKELIGQVLEQDPRPAYNKAAHQEKIYGMALYDLNIKWRVKQQQNIVLSVTKTF